MVKFCDNSVATVALKTAFQELDGDYLFWFIDRFSTISNNNFAKLVNDAFLVRHWKKYYTAKELREQLDFLTETNLLDFLNDYGNASETIFKKIKANPRLIKYWDEFNEIIFARSDINVLVEYARGKTKYWEFEHIRDLIGYPNKFQMIGAHWQITIQNMINNGSLRIFQALDLPPGNLATTSTTINVGIWIPITT